MPGGAGEKSVVGPPSWVPTGVDISVPNAARVYDYWLDGSCNFAADREMADQVRQVVPGARDGARINRAFLRRVVRFMADSGVRQFLDIGSGIPTVGNVHEVAQRVDPRCRIVYVDKEPVSVAHSNLLLTDNDQAAAIQANLRDVEDILDHPQTRRLVDFSQPVGLLMLWVLHFIPDSWEPAKIVARYRDRLAPGSYLAVSHVTTNGNPTGQAETIELYAKTADPVYFRSHQEILRLFDGFELVEPGLVGSALWRPSGSGDVSSDAEMNAISYGGVGRKL